MRHTYRFPALLSVAVCLLWLAAPALCQEPEILPLSQVKPGMKGYARTIFSGNEIENVDLEVIGIMPNLLGPKQDIIMVVLRGGKAEFTGVAGGMSGSPVYLEGRLAGALSLRFGIFSKQPIAGVTPIENVFEVGKPEAAAPVQRTAADPASPEPASGTLPMARAYVVPADFAQHAGLASGAFLTPIETPLAFSGFHPAAVQQFSAEFVAQGMVATHGGTVPPQPDDAQIVPGSMAGIVLMQGDLSLQGGCTVTAVVKNRVFVCGHPLFGHGNVALPMARGHVVTTLASAMASTKIMNAGGVIGTFTQDRLTAVMGALGPGPRLIPVQMSIVTPGVEKTFKFEMIEHPKFTPLLLSIAAFNGLIANTAYSEGMTFRMTGGIEIQGHATVRLENMFAPTDQLVPDGLSVAMAAQAVFARVYTNPYERVKVERVTLRIESIPERRVAVIESAWSEKSEVSPGETIKVKVLLRPYRGAPVMQEVPIAIPPQAARGSLRILVSGSETLNQQSRFFSGAQARLPGLEQLITLLNRERRNNQIYVSLLQPTPTLLLEEKELPNAPLSQIQVLDQRRAPGSSLLLRESVAGEWSVPMNQVITGQYAVTISVR